VPADTVTAVINQLKEFGAAQRGWLGVKIQSITDDIAESLGVPENTGALVAGVTPDSPAAKAGFEAGDVILKFDGKDVSTMRGLPRIVAQTPIGKSVEVEVLRQGQKRNVTVAVGRLDEDEDKIDLGQTQPKEESKQSATSLIGLALAPLTDELRAKFGLDAKLKGVVVTEIDPDSAAASKNIRVGDVIVEAQQEAVTTPDDVAKLVDKVKKSGGKQVLLLVEDGKGDTRFVTVPF
jgi:serine protease Do